MKLEYFNVIGLHGLYNYQVRFEHNNLILVAENGSGKTTLVNMLYYFLSRQWRKLNEYQFEKAILVLNGSEFIFEKRNYQPVFLRDSKIYRRFPLKYEKTIEYIFNHYNPREIRRHPELAEHLAVQLDVPLGLIQEVAHFYRGEEHRIEKDEKVTRLDSDLADILRGIQIVYLPTYRRIEKDLKNIFPHLEESMKEYEFKRRGKTFFNENENYVELVEFGMEDVKRQIEGRCSELRAYFYNNLSAKITGSYLEDILNKRYKNFDSSKTQSFNDEALKYILNRLDESIISAEGKVELRRFVERVKNKGAWSLSDEDKINAYFVWKLFQIYEEQQRAEIDINLFVDICNDYIGGRKNFQYDNDNFKVDIFLNQYQFGHQLIFPEFANEKSKHEKPKIDYRDLSSGEKQIVSLFSHLILSQRKYFIIIDEPELSLSVPWQERFLTDITSLERCAGMLAVTHSPFIFANDLKYYAHSLEEFSI
jgi:energy-coupling factor transporter ATP-binding protein EcfA2